MDWRLITQESPGFIHGECQVSRSLKKVSGIIEFDAPIIGSSAEISALAESCKPGSYESTMNYLRKGVGYAIPVNSIKLIAAIDLETIRLRFPDFVVPQSYYILNKKPELLNYFMSVPIIREIKEQ